MMDLTSLENNFTYHPPKEDQRDRYVELRKCGLDLARKIFHHCPESAERTLAIRRVEEAVMWGNASIARNE